MTSLVLFYIAGALVIGGAVGVVGSRNVVHAALFLLASLLGVAAVFLLVYAEFLAIVQILIYGGAIVIVVLFALMLTRLREFYGPMENRQWPLAALAAIALFGVMAVAFIKVGVPDKAERMGPGIQDLGQALFTQWAIPFEVASVLLLVALIGAIVIARAGGRE